MPPTLIPNNLSFIWVGTELPEKYAQNLIHWAELNPHYELILWTEAQWISAHGNTIAKVYTTNPTYQPSTAQEIVTTFNGSMLSIFREEGVPLQISLNAIESLTPIMDPALLYEELKAWKNYGAASDILRLLVLYNIGGIYMDMDTYPCGGSLPTVIHAPHGILFFDLIKTTKPGMTWHTLITPVLASIPQNAQLMQATSVLERRYSEGYPPIGTGVRSCAPQNQNHLMNLELARLNLARNVGTSDAEASRAVINKFLVEPTLTRMSGIFTHVIANEITDYGFDGFSFQEQTGYHPIVESHSSWQK